MAELLEPGGNLAYYFEIGANLKVEWANGFAKRRFSDPNFK